MANQALDEQESNFTIEATDRNTLKVFSNDVVWQRRLEGLGIVPTRASEYGKFYTVDLTQFSFGVRRKRQLSEEQRAANAERLAAYRAGEAGEDDSDAE
jgi:hypothetical protein